MNRSLFYTLLVSVALWTSSALGDGVQCLDESGNPVDWWLIMKVPYLEHSSDEAAASGLAYTYMDVNTGEFSYTGQRLDENLDGALGSTVSQILNEGYGDDMAWIMYNDQVPGDSKKRNSRHSESLGGHTKGLLAFDLDQGFWIIHSVPHFPFPPVNGSYSFPIGGKDFGQHIFCISVPAQAFHGLGTQFSITETHIYASNFPDSFSNFTEIQSIIDGHFVTHSTGNQTFKFDSLDGSLSLTSFAKNAHWDSFLYEDFVAPTLKQDLHVETWRRGSGGLLPSFCRHGSYDSTTSNFQYDVENVNNITINDNVQWGYVKDHSKWAVSANDQYTSGTWSCIGGINRMDSQNGRAGGTTCTDDPSIFKALSGIISTVDEC